MADQDRKTDAAPRLQAALRDRDQAHAQERARLDNVMQVPRFDEDRASTWASAGPRSSARCSTARSPTSRSITGQKPMVTKAKKSIASFKLREGNEIGAKVTLRGDRMWEFYDRLVSLAIPRIRDFRGMSPKQFDGSGNYTFGLTEQLVFPEIDYDNDRHGPGHGHHDRHHGSDRRPGPRTPARAGLPVPPRRPGVIDGEESTRPKAAARSRSSRSAATRAAAVAAARARCTATSGCAASACAQMAHAGEVPGVTKASW